MMLRTENLAGTTIYPMYKSGQLDVAHQDKDALGVFVPTGKLGGGGDWACTIERRTGSVVIESLEELSKLITALEIAFEKAKQIDTIPIHAQED